MTQDKQQGGKAQWEVKWECINCGCCHTTIEELPPEIPICPECGMDKLYVEDSKILENEEDKD